MERTRVWAMCAGGHQVRGASMDKGTWLRHDVSDGEVDVVVTRTDGMIDPYWRHRKDEDGMHVTRRSKVWRDSTGQVWVVLSGKAYLLDGELVVV